jgi:hypothetical protein
LFKRYALQLGAEAGPGSWEPVIVNEPTPDGKAIIAVTVIPIPDDHVPEPDPQPHSPRGRHSRVAGAVLWLLREQGDKFHSEIMEAMAHLGHSKTAANDTLKALVSLGLVLHPSKDSPYSLPNDPGE